MDEEVDRARKLLEQPGFLENAPAHVVEAAKLRLAAAEDAAQKAIPQTWVKATPDSFRNWPPGYVPFFFGPPPIYLVPVDEVGGPEWIYRLRMYQQAQDDSRRIHREWLAERKVQQEAWLAQKMADHPDWLSR